MKNYLMSRGAEKVVKTCVKVKAGEEVLIVTEVSKAANSMADKASTTDQVISNVAAITEENSAATEQVTASNEEQTACMHQVGETTNKLEELVGNLKNTVDKFKI